MAHYHTGEQAVQRRAGVEAMAQRVGGSIKPLMESGLQAFIQEQPMAILGAQTASGAMWASLVAGEAGMLQAIDAQTLRISGQLDSDDPLAAALVVDAALGVLVIDLATRQRVRVNGTIMRRDAAQIDVHVAEAYGNCPKYIQVRRHLAPAERSAQPRHCAQSTQLTAAQRESIAHADTFFIASGHPHSGADTSHRGGMPGFIAVDDDKTLIFPDYAGNMMFNTLGNIAANPAVGLLIPDFAHGAVLHISGQAEIVWDAARAAAIPGAERLVRVAIEQVIERSGALPFAWQFVNYSRFNPF